MPADLIRLTRCVHRDQSGQVTAWTVVVLVLFIGVMAFTVDAGFWLLDRRGGQNQVDASVLAGVQELVPPRPPDDLVDAANAAQDWLERNSRTDQGQVISECGLDEDDGYDELESPTAVPESVFAFKDANGDDLYDTIRACIRRDGLVIFARVFDLVGVTIPAVAAAGVDVDETPSRYALMAMNDSNCAGIPPSLNVRGDAEVILAGGGESYTALDCGSTNTLRTDGNGDLSGANHDVCGDGTDTGYEQGSPPAGEGLEPDLPTEGVCGVPDPWCNEAFCYPQPPPDGDPPGDCSNPAEYVKPADLGYTDFIFDQGEDDTTPNGEIELPPGTYCELVAMNAPPVPAGFDIRDCPSSPATAGCLTLKLLDGVYIFRDGFMVSGGMLIGEGGPPDPIDPENDTFEETDVVLYFTCATGTECGGTDRPRALDQGVPGGGCSEEATFCIQGNGLVALSAPESLPHILLWVDRTADAEGEVLIRVAGEGDITFDGHIYAWSGEVQIQGQGTGLNFNQTGTILGDTLDFAGQGTYTVTWDDEFPPPILITRIGLVE
jgi:hypothetical protein